MDKKLLNLIQNSAAFSSLAQPIKNTLIESINNGDENVIAEVYEILTEEAGLIAQMKKFLDEETEKIKKGLKITVAIAVKMAKNKKKETVSRKAEKNILQNLLQKIKKQK